MPRRYIGVLTVVVAIAMAVGCEGGQKTNIYSVYTGGDWHRGKQVIDQFRCGACHIIPGVNHADGLVGPPLTHWARRTYVGGEVPNKPEDLVKWIMDPQSIEPGTAMPNLGLTEQQARDAAAYLYTIR
jgi:cytochrome c